MNPTIKTILIGIAELLGALLVLGGFIYAIVMR